MNALDDTTLNTRYLANTHEVENVSCELADYNMYTQDTALREAVQREGAAWADADAARSSASCTGSADYLEQGNLANKHQPEFDTHDRFGNRIDLVKFHPAYHQFMDTAIRARPALLALDRPQRPAPMWPAPPATTCTARSRPGTAAPSP